MTICSAGPDTYVRDWLAQPNIDLLEPGPNHLRIALELLEEIGTRET